MARPRREPTEQAERQRVGHTLRTIRETRGMRQSELAAAMGISRAYMNQIESGKKRLTPVMLARAAAALYVPQMALMTPHGEGEAA